MARCRSGLQSFICGNGHLRGMLLAIFAMACIAPIAASAQSETTAQMIDAACNSNTSNVEYKECLRDYAEKVDRDLNALWGRVLASIDGADHLTKSQRADWRSKLIAAQRHWVQFKTADCREPVGYEWYGGTGMGGAVSTCLAKHTLDRAQDLRQRYLEK